MPQTMPGEELLRHAAHVLGAASEAVAVLIIGIAVINAVWHLARGLVRHAPSDAAVRSNLGRSLTLALEFMLAGDVARTAVAPTWEDIGKLAAVAIIRTGLNFFLSREMADPRMTTPPSL